MLLCGSIIIVIACSLVGFFLSGELAMREQNLRHFKNFILFLQNEITYKLTPVSIAVNRYCKEKGEQGEVNNSIIELLREHNSEDIGFAELFNSQKERIGFTGGDLNVINDFFDQLGLTDVNGQRSLFEVTLCRLEEGIVDAKKLSDQKGKLYKLLGLGTGIVVALMFI